MDKKYENYYYLMKCDECGRKFEIKTEPHAGVRDYFTCPCGEEYWIERGLIIYLREVDDNG